MATYICIYIYTLFVSKSSQASALKVPKFSGFKVAQQLHSNLTKYSKRKMHSYNFSGLTLIRIFLKC